MIPTRLEASWGWWGCHKTSLRERLFIATLWMVAGGALSVSDVWFMRALAVFYGFMAGNDIATIYWEWRAEKYRDIANNLLAIMGKVLAK